MMKRRGIDFIVVMFAVLVLLPLSVHAALEVRGTDSLGNQLIYDSDLNITWYDYTSLGPNGYGDTWQNQMNWASGLLVNFGDNIYDDWRLPSTDSCQEHYCTESEMGHLYYIELENIGYCDSPSNCALPGWGFKNTGDFQNISGTYVAHNSPNDFDPWRFNFNGGLQMHGDLFETYKAIAVRDGDVTIVPEPISSVLFIIGGALLARRRFIKKKA